MERVAPKMGGKKKTTPAGTWTLAGEPVCSSALAPTEERVFKEPVSYYREIAFRMREDPEEFYVVPFGPVKQDHSLRYSYHPHEGSEDSEEEGLPDPDIEEGDRLSEGQLFSLPPATPCRESRVLPDA